MSIESKSNLSSPLPALAATRAEKWRRPMTKTSTPTAQTARTLNWLTSYPMTEITGLFLPCLLPWLTPCQILCKGMYLKRMHLSIRDSKTCFCTCIVKKKIRRESELEIPRKKDCHEPLNSTSDRPHEHALWKKLPATVSMRHELVTVEVVSHQNIRPFQACE